MFRVGYKTEVKVEESSRQKRVPRPHNHLGLSRGTYEPRDGEDLILLGRGTFDFIRPQTQSKFRPLRGNYDGYIKDSKKNFFLTLFPSTVVPEDDVFQLLKCLPECDYENSFSKYQPSSTVSEEVGP